MLNVIKVKLLSERLDGAFRTWDGVSGIFIKQSLSRSLRKKERQFEKSTLSPVVAVVTNISYRCVRLVVNGRAGVS